MLHYFKFQLGKQNNHLSGKELFIRFTVRVVCKHLPICVCSFFPFGFAGKMWDSIVLVPDHYLFFYCV